MSFFRSKKSVIPSDKGCNFFLPLILIVGFGLRIYGIHFGLPYLSNFYIRPDETLIIMPALHLFESLGNPGGFAYPALMKVLCGIVFQLYFQILTLLQETKTQSVAEHFISSPSQYFLAARAISAISGSAIIFMVFWITKKISSRKIAYLSALLVAFAPLAVRDSHFAVTDTLLSLCTITCVGFILSYLEAAREQENRLLLLIAITAGLAISTKYSALLLFPSILLAILLKHSNDLKVVVFHVTKVAFFAAIVFAFMNPYAVIHPIDFIKESGGNVLSIMRKPLAPDGWGNTSKLQQLFMVLCEGPGGIIGLLLCCFAFIHIKNNMNILKRIIFLAGTFCIFTAPAFLTYPLPYRYMIPALPFIAIFSAMGATGIINSQKNISMKALVAAIIGIAVIYTFMQSLLMSVLLSRTDTRTLAWEWIHENVPQTVPILVAGSPEAEPQFYESASSLQNRIEYVNGLYGVKGGYITSEPYRLQLKDKKRHALGYIILRGKDRLPDIWETLCVIVPSYPLPMVGDGDSMKNISSLIPIKERHFKGFRGCGKELKLDTTDAFFLPFNRLNDVINPGPNIDIFLFHRG